MTIEEIMKSIKIQKNGCWDWQRGKTRGYGRVSYNKKVYPAHRLFYELFVQEIKHGNVVMHKCDNTACVNPKHLEQGSQKQNINDAFNKGRNIKPIGICAPWAKLNPEKVREIRKIEGKSYSEIAKDYNVSHDTIGLIKSRKRWAHVED